jgi:polar amino acid transport system substrate-binding protein
MLVTKILIPLVMLALPLTCLAEELVVGTESIEYSPYSASTDGSEYSGFYRQLLDKFAADNGHTMVYKPYPVKRLMLNFLNGKVDFKIPDNEFWASDQRKGHTIAYSNTLTTYIDGVMVLPENKGKPYEELKSLITVRGFTPFPFMAEISKGQINFNETNSIDAVIQMVESKRSYGGFLNVAVANYYMDNVMNSSSLLVYDEQLPKGISKISLSSISKPQIIKQLNNWMAANESWINELKKAHKVD